MGQYCASSIQIKLWFRLALALNLHNRTFSWSLCCDKSLFLTLTLKINILFNYDVIYVFMILVFIFIHTHIHTCGTSDKKSTCQCSRSKRCGSIQGLGKFPGVGNSNPIHYSCLENSMYRGAWRAIVHGVAKSQTWLSPAQINTDTYLCITINQMHLIGNRSQCGIKFKRWKNDLLKN